MNEQQKYSIVKNLVENNGNKKRAAIKLGVTIRTVDRMITGYKEEGKNFFIHGNRNRKPVHTINNHIKENIIHLYNEKYFDCNIQHFSELLLENEKIFISPSTIRKLFDENDMLSPKAWKKTKRNMTKRLKDKKTKATSIKDQQIIQKKLVSIEDAHPRRPRCKYFGEMLQMDASQHRWFGDTKTHLHLALDDSTGNIVGAFFDEEETLHGYYNVLYQVLNNYGIPNMFYTDRRTVFEYQKKKTSSVEKDTFTQFSYTCHQLGIDIKTTSIPQAKGRVERIFGTLQSRLIAELRLANVNSIKEANLFLNSYIKKYNEHFALIINHNKSVFEKQPEKNKINLLLSVRSERIIGNGHCIKFNKKYYKTTNSDGVSQYYSKGTKALVIKAFNNELFATIDEKIFALEEVPKYEAHSKNFDYLSTCVKTKKKKWIPPMDHPYKRQEFKKHVAQMPHRHSLNFEEVIYSQANMYGV